MSRVRTGGLSVGTRGAGGAGGAGEVGGAGGAGRKKAAMPLAAGPLGEAGTSADGVGLAESVEMQNGGSSLMSSSLCG